MLSDIEPLRILREQFEDIAAGLIALLPGLVAALVVIALTWAVAYAVPRATARLMRRWHERPALIAATTTVTRTAIWIIGGLVAAILVFPNLTATNVLAGLGLGSLLVGLAFKDIFENYMAGIMILVRKPMRIGDDISCQDVEGRVEAISIRDTYLRRRSGELILVPNAYIYGNPTTVLTDLPKRRITLEVGVAYDTDLETACRVLRGAFDGLETVDASRKVEVFATAFGDSSIDFVLRWWAGSTPVEELRSRDEVARSVKRALDAAGIVIPFPQRTLGFLGPLSVAEERPGSGSGA